MLRVAWYRARATRARQWGGYASLVLLVGLIGGAAIGSLAGAWRTQSAYSRVLAATKASDLIVSSFGTQLPSCRVGLRLD